MLTTAEKLTLWLFACIAGCWSEPRVQKSVHHRGACPCWPQFLAVAFRCAAFPSHTAVFLYCLLALKKGEKLGLAPNIAQAASDAARVSVCVCACVCVCVCVCAECCLLTAHTAPVANSPNPFISVHLCILPAVLPHSLCGPLPPPQRRCRRQLPSTMPCMCCSHQHLRSTQRSLLLPQPGL